MKNKITLKQFAIDKSIQYYQSDQYYAEEYYSKNIEKYVDLTLYQTESQHQKFINEMKKEGIDIKISYCVHDYDKNYILPVGIIKDTTKFLIRSKFTGKGVTKYGYLWLPKLYSLNELMIDNEYARTVFQSNRSSGTTIFIPHYYHEITDTYYGYTKSFKIINFTTRKGSNEIWFKIDNCKILPKNHKVRKILKLKSLSFDITQIKGII